MFVEHTVMVIPLFVDHTELVMTYFYEVGLTFLMIRTGVVLPVVDSVVEACYMFCTYAIVV